MPLPKLAPGASPIPPGVDWGAQQVSCNDKLHGQCFSLRALVWFVIAQTYVAAPIT